jgi:hypothetical protein
MSEGHEWAVFTKLDRKGCGPRSPLEVEHVFYLSSAASAERVGAFLREDGYRIAVTHQADAAPDSQWEIVATRIARISIEGMRVTRAKFEALMHAESGDYDGWDARPVS